MEGTQDLIPQDCKPLAEVERKDSAHFPWQEITKVQHYRLDVDHLR